LHTGAITYIIVIIVIIIIYTVVKLLSDITTPIYKRFMGGTMLSSVIIENARSERV